MRESSVSMFNIFFGGRGAQAPIEVLHNLNTSF